ncbi:GtrA family protein [bacterium]|nr:GtrA family protein [bacterium]
MDMFNQIKLLLHRYREFLRNFVCSVISTLFDLAVLITLVNVLDVHYLVGATAGYTLGIFVGYVISIRWVFASRSVKNKRHEMMIFVFICLAGLGISNGGLYIMADLLGVYYLYAKLVMLGIVYFWNYFVKKALLFTTKP